MWQAFPMTSWLCLWAETSWDTGQDESTGTTWNGNGKYWKHCFEVNLIGLSAVTVHLLHRVYLKHCGLINSTDGTVSYLAIQKGFTTKRSSHWSQKKCIPRKQWDWNSSFIRGGCISCALLTTWKKILFNKWLQRRSLVIVYSLMLCELNCVLGEIIHLSLMFAEYFE